MKDKMLVFVRGLSLKFVNFCPYGEGCGKWRVDPIPYPTNHYFMLETSYFKSSRRLYVTLIEKYGECCEEGDIASKIGETVFDDVCIEDAKELTPRLQEWAKNALIAAMRDYKNKIDTFLEAAESEPVVTEESDLYNAIHGYDTKEMLEYHAQGIRNLAERLGRSVESSRKTYEHF